MLARRQLALPIKVKLLFYEQVQQLRMLLSLQLEKLMEVLEKKHPGAACFVQLLPLLHGYLEPPGSYAPCHEFKLLGSDRVRSLFP